MSVESTPVGGLLSIVAPEERRHLEESGHNVRYPRGARLLQQGEPGDRVIVVLEGRAKVTWLSGDGREVVVDFRGPGELVGDLSAIDGAPRSSSVEAIEPVEALVLAASDLRALLERRPRLALGVLEVLATRFRDADRKRIEFGSLDTVGRLCARLVELAERYGEPTGDSIVIGLPISQEELAGWTAASQAGLAEALRTLRELGWVETGRLRITLHDLGALRTRASRF